MKYSKRFEAALVYASQVHEGHFRKGTQVPYITHPMAVAALVGEAGGTENEVIAALLHDAVEDCGGPPIEREIRERFGDTVGDIVIGCSDTDETPKPPWQKRKESYIKHLDDASESILLVSCADKLHNARSIVADYRQIGDELWNRFTGTKEQTLWYYRTLVEAFRRRDVSARLVDELDRTVQAMEDLVRQSA